MKDSCLKTAHLRLILSAFIWCGQRNSGVTSKQRDEQIHRVLIRVFLHIVPSLTATLFVNVKYHFQCCCFYFFLFNIMFPYREGRYLLIMTENFAALSRIKQLLLELDKEEPYVIFGSSFPKDQLFTQARVNFILLRKVPFLREWSVGHVVFFPFLHWFPLFFDRSFVPISLEKALNIICDLPQDFNAKGESTRTAGFHFKTKEFILTRFNTLAILPH